MSNLVSHGKFSRNSTEWSIGSDRRIYLEQDILAKKEQAKMNRHQSIDVRISKSYPNIPEKH